MTISDNLNKLLSKSIKTFLVDMRFHMNFYAHFDLEINFIESNNVETCAVNIDSKGMNFYYNNEFINRHTLKEVNFINLHELYHLLLNHHNRILSSYDHELSNIAQDMIINYLINTQINTSFIDIPKDKRGNNSILYIPKKYRGPIIFENLYEYLLIEKRKFEEENIEEELYGEFGKDNFECYSLKTIFTKLNSNEKIILDEHIEDEISSELRDVIIKNMIDSFKDRGIVSANNEIIINNLLSRKKDYLKEIKKSLSNEIFGNVSIKTIVKPNRRGIEGIKGKKKTKTIINCILDVSGSMKNTLDKTLSYIYQTNITVNLIQIDSSIKTISKIKSTKQLDTLKIKGGGGSIMQPAINYIVDNYNKYNTVLLTDGYVDSLDISKLNGKLLIISIDKKCKVNGKCKQIIIND